MVFHRCRTYSAKNCRFSTPKFVAHGLGMKREGIQYQPGFRRTVWLSGKRVESSSLVFWLTRFRFAAQPHIGMRLTDELQCVAAMWRAILSNYSPFKVSAPFS
eukprot:394662-Hanusia_phi.AAC.1